MTKEQKFLKDFREWFVGLLLIAISIGTVTGGIVWMCSGFSIVRLMLVTVWTLAVIAIWAALADSL